PAPVEPQPVAVAVAAPSISEAVEARLSHLEHRALVIESLAKAEQARLDWSLGAVEGFAAAIEDYHAIRRTKAYQAAFEAADPLVSVCVATVNRAEMLVDRALASLQAQTHRNLQIVVVGDHCTDDTARRIAALGDDRIVFANLPERGPYPPPGIDRWRVAGSNAMNHALSLCKGDFVTHLDDDDRMTADKIATMVAAARDNRADFLWHSFWYEHRDGRWEALGNGKLELGQVTTGSIFYHGYFARFGWDVHAYRLGEPGDWNRLRKIKMLRPRLHYVDRSLLFHHVEQAQPIFTSQDGERFLD
ncbi:MAG: glycosyltransferase family 2 protein, partial [Alphaproteobacteria bacterium]